KREHGSERGLVGLAVPGNGVGLIEENAVAAANRGLSVSENIPGEADARREVAPGGGESAVGDTGVARIHHAERRVGVTRRSLAGVPGGDTAVEVSVRGERLPADAQIDREARAELPGVMGEQGAAAESRVAVFAGALGDVAELADQEIAEGVRCKRGGTAIEGEAAVGAEIVGHVIDAATVLATQ